MQVCEACGRDYDPEEDLGDYADSVLAMEIINRKSRCFCLDCQFILFDKLDDIIENFPNNLTPQEQMLLRAKPAKALGDDIDGTSS